MQRFFLHLKTEFFALWRRVCVFIRKRKKALPPKIISESSRDTKHYHDFTWSMEILTSLFCLTSSSSSLWCEKANWQFRDLWNAHLFYHPSFAAAMSSSSSSSTCSTLSCRFYWLSFLHFLQTTPPSTINHRKMNIHAVYTIVCS